MKKEIKTYSDYWLDDLEDIKFDDNGDVKSTNSANIDIDLLKLSSAKRAISNFVNILTNKTIPVYFNLCKHFYHFSYCII